MKNEEKINARNVNYDLIRVISIYLVIHIHCYETLGLDIPFLYYLGRCAVPLFLLLTGALFKKTVTFKKLINIYIISFTYCAIFNLINCYISNNFDFFEVVKNSLKLFVNSNHYSFSKHIWYLKQITIIYVFLYIFSTNLKKSIKFICSYLLFIIILLFNNKYNIVSLIGLFLVLIGFLINKKIIFKNKIVLFFVFSIAFALFVISFNYIGKYTGDGWWYWNVFILMGSIIIFLILVNIKFIPFEKILAEISKSTFGMYIIHLPYIFFLEKYIDFIEMPILLKLLLLEIIIFITSFYTSYLIGKIRYVKKLLWR